jgi:hypothetical protein
MKYIITLYLHNLKFPNLLHPGVDSNPRSPVLDSETIPLHNATPPGHVLRFIISNIFMFQVVTWSIWISECQVTRPGKPGRGLPHRHQVQAQRRENGERRFCAFYKFRCIGFYKFCRNGFTSFVESVLQVLLNRFYKSYRIGFTSFIESVLQVLLNWSEYI